MAAFAAAAVAIPSFTGLRIESPKPAAPKPSAFAPAAKAPPSMAARASLRGNAIARLGMTVLAASAAGIMMAGNANAIEVLLGGNGGELQFIPKEFQVTSGESIVFKNNAAFPHNVVFDEDEVPAGVDVNAISMNEEDLLNAPGETYSVKLDKKGTYTFYCSPHKGSGMVGKVTVD